MLMMRRLVPAIAWLLSLAIAGCSNSSSPESGGTQPRILKAYGLTASAADSSAALSWPNLSGATAYNLYWSTRADLNPTNATKIANVTSPYTQSGLSNGTIYYFLFTAVTAAGESTPSNAVKVTPKTASAGAPANVSALAGDARITLTWDAVPGATTYTVYWNTRGDVNTQDTRVENITNPAVHTGLTNGQQYYYMVTATTSTYGEVASAEVSSAPHLAPPAPPSALSVSAGDRQANLSWTPVSDATGYAIYWNSSGNVSLADARFELTTPNYTHTGLNNGTRYFYRVAALNAQGSGVLSAAVSAKPHAPAPGAPSQVSATAGNEQVTLNWDQVPAATHYNLYWDTGGAVTVIANIQPPYEHTALTGGIPVNYAITALREGVESAGSAQISATPLGPLPPIPTQFTAVAAKNQITLTWNAVEQALSYRVYWTTSGNPAEATLTTASSSYTHTGLLDNTAYFYRIVAITADGMSPRSAEITATTFPATTPSQTTYTVGGRISGLSQTTAGLVLTLTGANGETLIETLSIPAGAATVFNFQTALPSGGTYSVAVSASPSTPLSQNCEVNTGTGTVTIINANSASVAITCTTNSFAVGGTVAGLAGDESVGLSLTTNGGMSQTATATGNSFAFNTALLSGSTYTLVITTNPGGKTCSFANNTGSLTGTITNTAVSVAVSCSGNLAYTVGGTISGLTSNSNGLVLTLTSANNTLIETLAIILGAATTFNFRTGLQSGGTYTVAVTASPRTPVSQNCGVRAGTGTWTIASANITGVVIDCTTNNFTLGGRIADVVGNGLTLGLSAGGNTQTLAVSPGATNFMFESPLPSGSAYTLSVATQPAGPSQSCSISGGVGTVTNANIASAIINCQVNWKLVNPVPSGYLLSNVVANGNVFVATSGFNGGSGIVTGTVRDGNIAWSVSTFTTPCCAYATKAIWANNQWVAIGSAGSIFTSPDGISWLARQSTVRTDLSNIIWTGNQLVVVGAGGTLLTSADGISWVSRTSGTANLLHDVVWTGSQFVAVGFGGTILSSPNGIQWTTQSAGTTDEFSKIIWTGQRLVVGSYNGSSLRSSADGISWSTPAPNIGPVADIIWNGSQVLAVGWSGFLTSPDAITWTLRSGGGSLTPNSSVWNGNQYVVVGEVGIATSSDGVVWTFQTKFTQLHGVTWTGTQFIAVGFYGVILTSPDGVTWTSVAPTNNSINGMTRTPTLWVAVGRGGSIITSPDGITWTARNSGIPTEDIMSVVWTGNQLVASGSTGSIITSTDGIAWSVRASVGIYFNSIVWTGTQLVGVGAGGGIMTSTEGVQWTTRASGTTQTLTRIVWTGSQLVAVGNVGSIQTSPDGVNWTARTSGIALDIVDIAWSGTLLLAAVNNNSVLSSVDGVSWLQTVNVLSASVVWTGQQWVNMFTFGMVSTSPDGLTWTSYNQNWAVSTPNSGGTFLYQIIRAGTAYAAFGFGGFIYIAQ